MMNAEEKLQILEKGKIVGVTNTCKEYNISRTLYYRWLSRYKASGLAGLENSLKNTHSLRTRAFNLEEVVLFVVVKHPEYGPQRISWFLSDEGIIISTSGVYNILKKHQLNAKLNRVQFSKRKKSSYEDLQLPSRTKTMPASENYTSGEYWLSWIDDLGYKDQIGSLYLYVALDVKSGFVCARLHSQKQLSFQRELLTHEVIPLCGEAIKWVMTKREEDVKSTLKEQHLFQKFLLKEKIEPLVWQEPPPLVSNQVAQFKKKMVSFWLNALSQKHSLVSLKEAFSSFIKDYNMEASAANGMATPYEMMTENKKVPISLMKWAQKSSLY